MNCIVEGSKGKPEIPFSGVTFLGSYVNGIVVVLCVPCKTSPIHITLSSKIKWRPHDCLGLLNHYLFFSPNRQPGLIHLAPGMCHSLVVPVLHAHPHLSFLSTTGLTQVFVLLGLRLPLRHKYWELAPAGATLSQQWIGIEIQFLPLSWGKMWAHPCYCQRALAGLDDPHSCSSNLLTRALCASLLPCPSPLPFLCFLWLLPK